jgi:ketosteroid isomerase-like protein
MEIPDWVRDLFRSIDRRDAAGFAAFLTEDATFRYASQPPVSGREAVQAYVAEFFVGLADVRHELLGYWWDEASRTCFVQGDVAYGLRDGREVTLPFINLLQLGDERIRRYLIYADPTPMLPP